jgi:hypothetical protein
MRKKILAASSAEIQNHLGDEFQFCGEQFSERTIFWEWVCGGKLSQIELAS